DEGMTVRSRDRDLDDAPDDALRRRIEVNDLVPLGAAFDEPRRLARSFDEDALPRADERGEVRARLRLGDLEKAREPFALHLFRDIVLELQRRRIRTLGILESEEADECGFPHEIERRGKVALRFAGEADDDVGREGETRTCATEPLDAMHVFCMCIPADHAL